MVIEDEAEATFLRSQTGGAAHYIGLTDLEAEGCFRWATPVPDPALPNAPDMGASCGSPTGYSNWSAGAPNGGEDVDCVQLSEDEAGTWRDVACSTPLPWICEYPAAL